LTRNVGIRRQGRADRVHVTEQDEVAVEAALRKRRRLAARRVARELVRRVRSGLRITCAASMAQMDC
jgi:hypothetical protein